MSLYKCFYGNILKENFRSFSKQLEDDFNRKYPAPEEGTEADKKGISIEMYLSPITDTVSLDSIYIPKQLRKQDIGTQIMNKIVDYADKNGKTITLTPSTDFGATSVGRLKKFYKRFGFVENKGKNKDFKVRDTMYRTPTGKN